MTQLETPSARNWWPYICLALAVTAVAAMCYHPYYFGDELFSHYFAFKPNSSFWSVLAGLDAYKPRILYNMMWAGIASSNLPRLIPISVTVICLSIAAGVSYRIALYRLRAPVYAAAAVAFLLIFSRFGVILYFDAVSGTIESLSLAFFVICLDLRLREVDSSYNPTIGRVAILLLSIALILVHERYYAGIFVIGASQLMADGRKGRQAIISSRSILSLLIIAVPPAIFVLASHYMTALSIATGTAGIPIKLGTDTAFTFATNAANSFLGLNYGMRWLVGSFNMDVQSDRTIMLAGAPLFALAWIAPLLVRRPRRVEITHGLLLVSLALALIAVASLPGSARQEGRWLFPVGLLVSLLAVSLYKGWVRVILLTLLLTTNVLQLATNSYSSIYNITSSRSAAELGAALDIISAPGSRHLLIGTPNLDWALGGVQLAGNQGYEGDTYCRSNLQADTCFDLSTTETLSQLSKYNDAWIYTRGSGSRESAYRIMPIGVARLLSNQGTSSHQVAADMKIGIDRRWSGWNWTSGPSFRREGIELAPGISGTRRLDIKMLTGRVLTYHAKSLGATSVPMRLQINWIDAKGTFLGTSIKVVRVGASWSYFGMLVEPPERASFGDVYATLHDNADGQVLLDSISLTGGANATAKDAINR